MLIALDYDNTYTADPELWDSFITMSQGRGHRVIVATMRDETLEGKIVKIDLGLKADDIIFTNRKAKKPFLAAMNIHPDIWIDDIPEFIVANAKCC